MTDYTYDEVMTALRNADAAGDADAARRLARIASEMSQPKKRLMGSVNQGIARGIDSAAGLVNRGVNAALGTSLSETPTADLMDATQALPEWARIARNPNPEGIVERGLAGAGEAASYLIPATGAMRAAQGGSGVLAKAGQTLAQPFIRTPATAIGAELASGAGGEAARVVAEQSTDSPFVQNSAALAGALAGGLGVGGVAAAAKYGPTGQLVRGIKAATVPFTEKGARVIAEDIVQGAVADPDRAITRLQDPNVGNLTPAQQTGEVNLMALERGFADKNPRMAEALEARAAQSREALTAAAREGAQGKLTADTRKFFAERIEQHRTFLGGLLDSANKRAEKALADVEPRGRPVAQSEIVRTEVTRAFEAASKREAALWNRVPKSVEVGTTQARAALKAALKETTDVSADSIPSKAREFLGEDGSFGETVTMDRLHRLYSEMRKSAREAMAQNVPDEFRARQANRIADAILADIDATSPGGAAKALADARAFSKEMNSVFGQYTGGRLMSVQRSGADRVREGLTLDQTVGVGGNAGALAVDDIRATTGYSPSAEGARNADRATEDYVRSMFKGAVVRGDQISLSRAESFVRANAELIDRFPDGFKPAMEAAIDAAKNADVRGDRVAQALKALGDRNAPGTVGFVNAKAGQEVAQAIYAAENPTRAARNLASAALKDQTGDAYLGLKGGLIDELMARAFKGDKIKGDALARQLSDPTTASVLRQVLSPQERAALRTVATQLKKLDDWDIAKIDDVRNAPNQLVATFLQVQAAKAGRALGTGTIQAPGIMVRRTQDLLRRVSVGRADSLIHDAMQDPKLLSALLTGPGSTKAKIEEANRALSNWAIGAIAAQEAEN